MADLSFEGVSTSVSGSLSGFAFAADEPWPMLGAGLEGAVFGLNMINAIWGPKKRPPPPQDASELVKCLSLVTKRLEASIASEFTTKFKGNIEGFVKLTREKVYVEAEDLIANLEEYASQPNNSLCYLQQPKKLSLYQSYVDDFSVKNNDLNQLSGLLNWYKARDLKGQVGGIGVYFQALKAIVEHVHELAQMQIVLNQHAQPRVHQERPLIGWFCLDHDIVKIHLVNYLTEADSFVEALLTKLEDGFEFCDNIEQVVQKKFAVKNSGANWGVSVDGATPASWHADQAAANQQAALMRAQAVPQMRTWKQDNLHLDLTSKKEIAAYREAQEALNSLKDQILNNATTARQKVLGRSNSQITPIRLQVLPSPGLLRFRYETNNDKWVGVVANSVLGGGRVVSQNAGSNDDGIYYQVGGGGINRVFHDTLDTSPSQLDAANTALSDAYDAHYGDGSFMQDSLMLPDDKRANLVIPLVSSQGQVGSEVKAMLYTVGPKLDPAMALQDAAMRKEYVQLYADAFTAVLDWNASHPATEKVDFIRLTFVSCGIYANGTKNEQQLFDDAASCMIDAAMQVLGKRPELSNLGFLVNCRGTFSDNGVAAVSTDTSLERNGFNNAVQAFLNKPMNSPRAVTNEAEYGFDLWEAGKGPAWPPT